MASRPSSKKKSVKDHLLTFIKWIVLLGIIAGLAGVAAVAGLFYYFGQDLPELMEREDYDPPQLSKVYSDDGELLAEFHVPGERRTLIDLEDIPTHVQKAFLAAEDSDFMIHDGIDYLGMVRAIYFAFRYDQGMRGTSTITQQLIKNIVLTPERAYERKIQEIILARELEQNLSKEDILYMYLNTIYLGHGHHGIKEAARFYFGKSVEDLEIQEAALLAGMTSGPENASPHRNIDRAYQRRAFTLRQMWENGFINEGQYHEAMESDIETVSFRESYPHIGEAPYFVDHVRRLIVDHYGRDALFEGGLRIHTTLDLDAQHAAERAARRGLRDYDARRTFFRPSGQIDEEDIDDFIRASHDDLSLPLYPTDTVDAVVTDIDVDEEDITLAFGDFQATLILEPRTRILGEGSDKKDLDEAFSVGDILTVSPTTNLTADSDTLIDVRFERGAEASVTSIDPHTRAVVALVGGYDFDLNEYNHATQASRQTGSSFKTLVYAAALEDRIISPASVYLDSPTVFQMHDGSDWSPTNADGEWRGPMRVREALGASRNVVAVRVLDDLGVDRAIDFSRRIGVHSDMVRNHTMVMGSGEMRPLEITNAYATFASGGNYADPRFLNRVETVRGESEDFRTHSEPVLAPEVAYLITSLLESAVSGYVDREGNFRGGTGHAIARALDHPIAGKTGTTNNSRDAWFIGYTPDLVTGVWVGFSDNSSLGRREYGGRVAGPIYKYFKQQLLDGVDPVEFEEPTSGITTARIDPITGKLARGDDGIEEVFLVGTAPTEYAPEEDEDTGESFFLDQFQ